MKKILLYTLIATIAFSSSTAAFAECGGKHHGKGKIFKKMDINSDGVVTKDEFLSKAEERFAKMDSNGDGKVTKDEIKEHHKKMKEKFKKKHDDDDDHKDDHDDEHDDKHDDDHDD